MSVLKSSKGRSARRLLLSTAALLLFGTFFAFSFLDMLRLIDLGLSSLDFHTVPAGVGGSDGSNVSQGNAFVFVVTGFVTGILLWEVRNAWKEYSATRGHEQSPS